MDRIGYVYWVHVFAKNILNVWIYHTNRCILYYFPDDLERRYTPHRSKSKNGKHWHISFRNLSKIIENYSTSKINNYQLQHSFHSTGKNVLNIGSHNVEFIHIHVFTWNMDIILINLQMLQNMRNMAHKWRFDIYLKPIHHRLCICY